jgi:hypothetical protein
MFVEIWAMFVWSLQQMLCLVPMHFNTTFSCSSHRGARSVENPWFHSDSWQAFSTRCCNTTMSLIGAEYTKVVLVPTAKHSEDSGQEIMQSSWLGLRVLSTVHRNSGSGAVWQCGENEAMPHHAWTTRVVVDEEAHIARVLVNLSPKSDGKLHLLSLLGKTTSPNCWSPEMPTRTLMVDRFWCLDATAVWALWNTVPCESRLLS